MSRYLPALLAVAVCGLAAEKKPVTIESLFAAPQERAGRRPPGTPEWAPDGRRFVVTDAGTVVLYDVVSGARKDLVKLAALAEKAVKTTPPESFGWQNRGVSERAIQWSALGREILIANGGDLFLLHVDTAAWDQLTATSETEHDPKLSPDARYVSFRRAHDLYAEEIASKKVTRLTTGGSPTLLNGELDWVYPEELDLGTAHWWSPDSRMIAFLQFDVSREPVFPHAYLLTTLAKYEPQRFPQPGMPNADVRLGIVKVDGGPVRWIDLGDPRDALLARVYWSPDAGHPVLAAERLNRIQNRIELHLVDAPSGESRVVLREQDPTWINVNDDFRFLQNGKQFLWGSERSGFRHLYVYDADGREVRQVTRGDWEVSDLACVDEPGRRLYYVSTEASPLERQFYSIGLDGRHKQRLSSQPGTHGISMGPGCAWYLDSYSSLVSPPRRALHKADGAEVRVYEEAKPVDFEILPAEIVKVKADDGETMYARLIKPAGFQPGRKYPLVVLVYGGPHVQTVRDMWAPPGMDQVLARKGFVIWSLDNRGSSGRGHRWESQVNRNLGAKELEDQQTGIRYLESLGFVDSARIGIHGWSYGGYMTLYALTNAPKLFRAGAAGAPVTDWRNYDTIYTERYMDLPENNPEGYKRSSPITNTGRLEAELLILHNLEDDNVHFQNTVQMADALERAGKQFRMVVYPQRTHAVTGPVARHLMETVVGFFEKSLR